MRTTHRPTVHAIAACALLALAPAAWADWGDDWMAGKITAGPAVTYAGPPIEIKYGHPSPPASVTAAPP